MRTSKLTAEEVEDFWIRAYLGSVDYLAACVDRAYRDFSRTLHGIGKIQSKESHKEIRKVMIEIAKNLLTKQFTSQSEFDDWHQEMCLRLKSEFESKRNHDIRIGQAQKWINMTAKYLFALGNRVNWKCKNYVYFHIPIDNIILNKLNFRFGTRWSRIDNYADYLNFQIWIRQTYEDELPLDVEFRLYNRAIEERMM